MEAFIKEDVSIKTKVKGRDIQQVKGTIVEAYGGHIVRSTGRKDRHSKVYTAKGLRDRRVRLSAHTAIQFYDVQDRLGYDRPSKAVDWLIQHAKAAIDRLAPRDDSLPIGQAQYSVNSVRNDQTDNVVNTTVPTCFSSGSSYQNYIPISRDLRLSLQSVREEAPAVQFGRDFGHQDFFRCDWSAGEAEASSEFSVIRGWVDSTSISSAALIPIASGSYGGFTGVRGDEGASGMNHQSGFRHG